MGLDVISDRLPEMRGDAVKTYIVKVQLAFEHHRDAQRCVDELSNTVFDRCTEAHYAMEVDDHR